MWTEEILLGDALRGRFFAPDWRPPGPWIPPRPDCWLVDLSHEGDGWSQQWLPAPSDGVSYGIYLLRAVARRVVPFRTPMRSGSLLSRWIHRIRDADWSCALMHGDQRRAQIHRGAKKLVGSARKLEIRSELHQLGCLPN